jgi:hypothetical protein
MRSEQMPVRPERGLGLKACPGTSCRFLHEKRWIENEGTIGALFLERNAPYVPFRSPKFPSMSLIPQMLNGMEEVIGSISIRSTK